MTHYTCHVGMLCEKGYKVALLASLCFLLFHFIFYFFFLLFISPTGKEQYHNIAYEVEYITCGQTIDVSLFVPFITSNCSTDASCSLCGILIVWSMNTDKSLTFIFLRSVTVSLLDII